MSRLTNSELEPPFIPPVTYDLLTSLETPLVTEPDRWDKQFRTSQLRLYTYCRRNLRDYMAELQRDDVLCEVSLIYAGLRLTVQENASGTVAVDDLPPVGGLGSHMFNSGLNTGHAIEIPFADLIDDGGMRARFRDYQPYAAYQLIEYILGRTFSEPQTRAVLTATAFVYDALERQIQINLLEAVLDEPPTG